MRFYHFLLLPVGFVGAVLGAFIWRGRGGARARRLARSNASSSSSPGKCSASTSTTSCRSSSIGAIFFGGAAWPLFDAGWIRRSSGGGALAPCSRPRSSSRCWLAAFYCSSVTQAYFAPRGMAERMRQAGAPSTRHRRQRPGHRRGRLRHHVADPAVFRAPEGMELRRRRSHAAGRRQPAPLGARYFVTTQWTHFKQTRPEAAAYLERYRPVDVPGAPGDTVMIELR